MGFIAADRSQGKLFGYSLEDFVGPEAKCRFVVEVVRQLDLSALYADYSDQGGDAYDPGTMLATWFFAYSEGISSTRRLEELCRRDMHYIYVSADLRPDHCALSRFRQRHAQRLPDLFVQIIRLARERGVSEFRRIMTDGSKMEAAASSRQSRGSKELKAELARVKEQIAQYLEQSELLDEQQDEEALQLAQVRSKMQKLAQMEARLLHRQQQLEQRKKTLQSKDRSRHKINLVEPEARNMKQVNGRLAAPAYNAQLSVDADSQLIVAAELTDDPNDRNQFSEQHAQVEQNLGADCERQYTADAGYHSLEQLEYADQQEVDVVIADPRPASRAAADAKEQRPGEGKEVFRRADFRYDERTDHYECPAGRQLTYWYTENKRGRRIRHYRARGCGGCALRDRCMKGCKPDSDRTITRDEAEHLAEAMYEKARGPEGRHRLKERATTVEPVIGNLKSNLGFRRFRLRGKAKAGAEFVLMCIGHNLGKLHGLATGPAGHGTALVATVPTAFAFLRRWLKTITHRTRPCPLPSFVHGL
jgi:transposase